MSGPIYTLRHVGAHDYEFLFGVKIAVRQSKALFNWNESFREFKRKLVPDKEEIIQHQGRDVGRLRLVWFDEYIYLGGIQILPAYQDRGIGSAILNDLKKEAQNQGIEVMLEVHEMNEKAFRLYVHHGFVSMGPSTHVPCSIEMRYFPE